MSPDAAVPSDASADVPDAPIAPPPPGVLPPEPWIPALFAPPRPFGVYVDGNFAFQLVAHPGGGKTASWATGIDRSLQVTVGTPASDQVVLRLPDKPNLRIDVPGLLRGRLHHEIRTGLGESVLSQAIRQATTPAIG